MAEESKRDSVRRAAQNITKHADAMHEAAGRLSGVDPGTSVQILAWSDSLNTYAGHVLHAANTADEETLKRVFLSDNAQHNASAVEERVASLRRSIERRAIEEMQHHVAALAALPGDPIIGLPSPIREMEHPASVF